MRKGKNGKESVSRQEDRLIKITEVAELLDLSTRTIRSWIKQGKFPRPLVLSRNVNRWRLSEVLKLMKKLASPKTPLAG